MILNRPKYFLYYWLNLNPTRSPHVHGYGQNGYIHILYSILEIQLYPVQPLGTIIFPLLIYLNIIFFKMSAVLKCVISKRNFLVLQLTIPTTQIFHHQNQQNQTRQLLNFHFYLILNSVLNYIDL